MATEIERKYLVVGPFMDFVTSSHSIKQGYLSIDAERIVRIRIYDKSGFITIKGRQTGISRFEWEKEIDVAEAEELLLLCQGHIVEKTRHIAPNGNFEIEIDQFYGENDGLVLAEIELESEDDTPPLPEWLGEDVSMDHRFHNSYLCQFPYTRW